MQKRHRIVSCPVAWTLCTAHALGAIAIGVIIWQDRQNPDAYQLWLPLVLVDLPSSYLTNALLEALNWHGTIATTLMFVVVGGIQYYVLGLALCKVVTLLRLRPTRLSSKDSFRLVDRETQTTTNEADEQS